MKSSLYKAITVTAAVLALYPTLPSFGQDVPPSKPSAPSYTNDNLPNPLFVGMHHSRVPVVPLTPEELREQAAARDDMIQAERFLADGQPEAAIRQMQSAVKVCPGFLTAISFDMARADTMRGDWPGAVHWYRTTVYRGRPDERQHGGSWGATEVMVDYALALLKTKEFPEAAQIYNAVATELGYSVPMPLPLCDRQTAADDPQMVEALVHTARSACPFDWTEPQPNADEAVRLEPRLAIAHFYRGEAFWTHRHLREAFAEYRLAASLGDAPMKKAVRKVLADPCYRQVVGVSGTN